MNACFYYWRLNKSNINPLTYVWIKNTYFLMDFGLSSQVFSVLFKQFNIISINKCSANI